MSQQPLSRWQQFYWYDPILVKIPLSTYMHQAARKFTENNCRNIIDLGLGAGWDTLLLSGYGAQVIGLDCGVALPARRVVGLIRMGLILKKPVLVQRRIDSGFCLNNLRTVGWWPTLWAGRKILKAAKAAHYRRLQSLGDDGLK